MTRPPFPHPLFLLGLLAIFLPSAAHAIDCTQTTVLSAPSATIPEQTALRVLLEESAKRTGSPWATATTYPRKATPGCIIVAATQANLPALLPPTLQRVQFHTPTPPESFSLNTFLWHGRETIVLAGRDSRGLLYAVGALLRTMELSPGKALLPQQLHLAQSPAKPIRGHQLGYRAKNNTYDAWTLAQFEQYIRELALFGANTIQLIAPDSDDAPTSPLFPAPALETLLGISKILDQYSLDCSLFYPEMEPDYAKPEDVARELARFEKLFAQIPRVDSIWIPGGDPGHTPPNLLFPLVEKEAAILHRYHPNAKIYLSAQGMSAEHFEDFYRQLDEKPTWLTGIFFGPQSRDSFETQRRRIPAQYPILFYPDIAHTMHAQFPVPNWDPVFALTEGREPINPRPIDEAAIYRHFASLQAGFITYSEGVNDDVNKFLWTAWGWNPATPAQSILEDYSRIFLGPELAKPFTQSLFALEENWRGPLLQNTQIERTATELDTLSREPAPPIEIQGQRAASYQPQEENHSSTKGPKARSIALRPGPEASAGASSKILFVPIQQALKDNWRFELALERAHYDAFLRQRLTAETDQQKTALAALGQAWQTGSEKALANAEDALTSPQAAAAERTKIFALADNLFHHIGLQLSTTLYQASNWERGANLDRIDIPLNDRVWLTNQFTRIRKLPTEAEKQAAIAKIVHWDAPQPGALHDDLGNPANEPHLLRGKGFAEDPELYQTAIDGVSDHTPLDGSRWSQLTYAETLYETPLQLAYTGLDPAKYYRLRVTYGGEDYTAPIGIEIADPASGNLTIQPQHNRATNPETLEFDIPQSATCTGNLTLKFTRPTGTGGSGRGHQVAETWLIPNS